MSMACPRAPWLRSGLNVIDGCVAGDEIERDRDGVGRPVVGLSFGLSVGRGRLKEENEATREDETERRKEGTSDEEEEREV